MRVLSIILLLSAAPAEVLTFRCAGRTCVAHADDLPELDPSEATLLNAPDDVDFSQATAQSEGEATKKSVDPVRCEGRSLVSTVSRAIRISTRTATVSSYCSEGVLLRKTPASVLVDKNGPTFCTILSVDSDVLLLSLLTFDNRECCRSSRPVLADARASVVHMPTSSRLDAFSTFRNLTFFGDRGDVSMFFPSPSTATSPLKMSDPSFRSVRGNGSLVVFALVTGKAKFDSFRGLSLHVLREPAAGVDRPFESDGIIDRDATRSAPSWQ